MGIASFFVSNTDFIESVSDETTWLASYKKYVQAAEPFFSALEVLLSNLSGIADAIVMVEFDPVNIFAAHDEFLARHNYLVTDLNLFAENQTTLSHLLPAFRTARDAIESDLEALTSARVTFSRDLAKLIEYRREFLDAGAGFPYQYYEAQRVFHAEHKAAINGFESLTDLSKDLESSAGALCLSFMRFNETNGVSDIDPLIEAVFAAHQALVMPLKVQIAEYVLFAKDSSDFVSRLSKWLLTLRGSVSELERVLRNFQGVLKELQNYFADPQARFAEYPAVVALQSQNFFDLSGEMPRERATDIDGFLTHVEALLPIALDRAIEVEEWCSEADLRARKLTSMLNEAKVRIEAKDRALRRIYLITKADLRRAFPEPLDSALFALENIQIKESVFDQAISDDLQSVGLEIAALDTNRGVLAVEFLAGQVALRKGFLGSGAIRKAFFPDDSASDKPNRWWGRG